MTEPIHATADPVAVILARMEVKLDNALTEQSRHSTIIERHDQILGEHGNRITAIETRVQADEGHQQRTVSSRTVFWSAAAAVFIFLGVIVTLILTLAHK